MQICRCRPNGKHRILLSESLTGIHGTAEEMSDIASDGKLDDAKHKREDCQYREKRNGRVGMDNIPDGRSRNNHKRTSPKIIAQILYPGNKLMEFVHIMLYEISKDHRQKQHVEHLF